MPPDPDVRRPGRGDSGEGGHAVDDETGFFVRKQGVDCDEGEVWQ